MAGVKPAVKVSEKERSAGGNGGEGNDSRSSAPQGARDFHNDDIPF